MFSKKEFYKIHSTFIQETAKQQRNKPHNHWNEEVFSETLLPRFAHCSVFLDEWQATNYLWKSPAKSFQVKCARKARCALEQSAESPVPCPAVARELPARPRLAAPAHANCSLGRDGRALTGGAQECQPRLPPSSLPQVFPPAGAMGFQESRSVHCSQLIRASRTPRLLSEAIGKSSCNPAFELRGYCRLQWLY